MPQKNDALKKIGDFFATRFVLRENSLWRVMGLIKPLRRSVIAANILLALGSVLGSFVLVSLMPLFEFTLNPQQPAKTTVSAPDPGHEKPDEKHKEKERLSVRIGKIKFLNEWAGGLQRGVAHLEGRYDAVMAWGRAHSQPFVLILCGFMLALLMLQGAVQFAGNSMMGKVGIKVTGNLLRDVYGNVLDQEMKFFDQTSTGTLINTCYREVFELRNIISFLVSRRVMLPIEMMILFCTLLVISWKFTLLLCCLLPLVILPTMLLTRQLKKAIREMMQGEAGPIDLMTESFHGIRAIKAFSAEAAEKRQMAPAVSEYETYANKRRSSQALIEPTVDVLNTLVILLVFAAICFFLPASLAEKDTQIRLLAFMAAVQRFYKPFRQMMTMNLSMQRASMAARRIFTLLDRKPQIVDAADAVEFPADWRELSFNDVYLAYEVFFKGQSRLRKALRGVSFKIQRGEAVAFVGPNGAGKSSIVNLICRLYDPTGGSITLDRVALKKIRLASLREKVCLITQHPILFNRSVSENIAFGLDGVSQERIEEAARAVNAHNFIMGLPDGYESSIGESGKLLSGGERQKIVLARAFVRQPDVLILDEPTTGLDKETTEEFLELVSELRRRKMTIIYITHEPTHLSRFDRVLQLTQERKVVEAAAALP